MSAGTNQLVFIYGAGREKIDNYLYPKPDIFVAHIIESGTHTAYSYEAAYAESGGHKV